jgi:hypothetical protein
MLALLWMQRWFIPHTYLQLAAQLLIAGTVYGLGLLWVVWSGRALRVGELASKQALMTAEDATVEAAETYQPER